MLFAITFLVVDSWAVDCSCACITAKAYLPQDAVFDVLSWLIRQVQDPLPCTGSAASVRLTTSRGIPASHILTRPPPLVGSVAPIITTVRIAAVSIAVSLALRYHPAQMVCGVERLVEVGPYMVLQLSFDIEDVASDTGMRDNQVQVHDSKTRGTMGNTMIARRILEDEIDLATLLICRDIVVPSNLPLDSAQRRLRLMTVDNCIERTVVRPVWWSVQNGENRAQHSQSKAWVKDDKTRKPTAELLLLFQEYDRISGFARIERLDLAIQEYLYRLTESSE